MSSGMQIYFTLEEIREIGYCVDEINFGSDTESDRSIIRTDILDKCSKARIKRLGESRPLNLFEDKKKDPPLPF